MLNSNNTWKTQVCKDKRKN